MVRAVYEDCKFEKPDSASAHAPRLEHACADDQMMPSVSDLGDDVDGVFHLGGLMRGRDGGARRAKPSGTAGETTGRTKTSRCWASLVICRRVRPSRTAPARWRWWTSMVSKPAALQAADEQPVLRFSRCDALGLVQDHLEGLVGGGGLCRRQRRRENVGAADVSQVVDELLLAGDIAAHRWDGLAEGAHLDVDGVPACRSAPRCRGRLRPARPPSGLRRSSGRRHNDGRAPPRGADR